MSLSKEEPKFYLSKSEYKTVILSKIENLSETIKLYRFSFPKESKDLFSGLQVGDYISIRKLLNPKLDTKKTVRYYSPTSLPSTKGCVDLCIKYVPPQKKNDDDKISMSEFLNKMKIGEEMEMNGPCGGVKQFKEIPSRIKKIGFLAGGSGFTVPYQFIMENYRNKNKDNLEISMIYGAPKISELVLKKDLDLASKNDDKVKVIYTVDSLKNETEENAKKWKENKENYVGFVTKDLIQKYMPKPGNDIFIVYVGPPGMNKACKGALETLGYEKDQIFTFY